MSLISFIANNTLLISIVVIILFLFIQFYLKPKFIDEKEKPLTDKQVEMSNDVKDAHSKETDTLIKRMDRGFQTMGLKLKNSEYLKNMIEAQNKPSESYLPEELNVKSEYQFETDLSKYN